jgi:hypothetical protein
MRSTQKQVRALYREVRDLLGVRTNQQANDHIIKALKYYTRKLSYHAISAVMLTPYRSGSWALYGINNVNGNTRETTLYISAESMLDRPTTVYKKFIEKALKGCKPE